MTRTQRLLGWLLAVALPAAGCSGVHSDFDVARVSIENDVLLDVEPGLGAGLYVEYYTGGDWYVFTTCDTARSGFGCDFNVSIEVPSGRGIFGVGGDDLEFAEDDVSSGFDSLYLSTRTFDDYDGVHFSTDAGTTLRLDFDLDGLTQPEVLFWNSKGRIRSDAPTLPLDLKPEAP